MYDSVKKIIAGYIIANTLKKKQNEPRSFKDLFKDSRSVFLLMPDDENDFKLSVEVFQELEKRGKAITAFTKDFRIGLLPQKFHHNIMGYSPEDLTRVNLPSRLLREKLSGMEFDLVIDLNRPNNLFYSFVANLVNAPFRIGIKKNNSDKYYNLQVSDSKDNPEIFYKNFLNCLQMF